MVPGVLRRMILAPVASFQNVNGLSKHLVGDVDEFVFSKQSDTTIVIPFGEKASVSMIRVNSNRASDGITSSSSACLCFALSLMNGMQAIVNERLLRRPDAGSRYRSDLIAAKHQTYGLIEPNHGLEVLLLRVS